MRGLRLGPRVRRDPRRAVFPNGRVLERPARVDRPAEALVEQRARRPLDAAGGARRVDAGGPVRDAVEREQELVGTLLRAPADFAAVVGEARAYGEAERLGAREDAVGAQSTDRHRHCRRGARRGGEGAAAVDHQRDGDRTDSLARAPGERVLLAHLAQPCRLNVPAADGRRWCGGGRPGTGRPASR